MGNYHGGDLPFLSLEAAGVSQLGIFKALLF